MFVLLYLSLNLYFHKSKQFNICLVKKKNRKTFIGYFRFGSDGLYLMQAFEVLYSIPFTGKEIVLCVIYADISFLFLFIHQDVDFQKVLNPSLFWAQTFIYGSLVASKALLFVYVFVSWFFLV